MQTILPMAASGYPSRGWPRTIGSRSILAPRRRLSPAGDSASGAMSFTTRERSRSAPAASITPGFSAPALVERRALDLRVGQLTRGELEALLGIPDHRVLDLVTMLGQHRTVARREREGPQRLEDLAGVAQVRLRVVDGAAQVLEDFSLRLERGRHPSIDREAAEVAAPGDPHAAEVTRARPPQATAGL